MTPEENEKPERALPDAPSDGEGSTSDRQRQSQRDLDAHDRMMASRAAHAARDTLHDSTPFQEPGSYTVFEARDRAAHTPSIAGETERQSTMADTDKSIFTDKERYLLDVQQRKDMAEFFPEGEEAKWLGERNRLAEVNPDGPAARQIAEEGRQAKIYADAPEGAKSQGQNNERKVATEVSPEQKANVDKALSDVQLSSQIGGATDVGSKPQPNDPTPIDNSRALGQDLQQQGVTMDRDK
jgi:hypothetical protein